MIERISSLISCANARQPLTPYTGHVFFTYSNTTPCLTTVRGGNTMHFACSYALASMNTPIFTKPNRALLHPLRLSTRLERFSSGVLGVFTCIPTSCEATDWSARLRTDSINCSTLSCIRKVRNLVIEFKPYYLPEYISEYTLPSSKVGCIRPN